MSEKYKFILILPYDIEVDSEEEIEGHVSWPNYSQASPRTYKGVFDSYEEALEYAKDFSLYKYVIDSYCYDSFESEDFPVYFVSIFDAEDAVCNYLGITPGDPVCVNADEFTIEEIEYEGNKVYKYCLYYNDECVYDSIDEDIYYDSYDDALYDAEIAKSDFEVELGGLDEYYSLEPIETVDIRIEKIEE